MLAAGRRGDFRLSDVATAQRILAQLEAEQIGSAVLRVADCGARGKRSVLIFRRTFARGAGAEWNQSNASGARRLANATSPTILERF